MISCRTTRPRDAPSDMRTAISRSRAAARTSSRLPTFAHGDEQHDAGTRHQNVEQRRVVLARIVLAAGDPADHSAVVRRSGS